MHLDKSGFWFSPPAVDPFDTPEDKVSVECLVEDSCNQYHWPLTLHTPCIHLPINVKGPLLPGLKPTKVGVHIKRRRHQRLIDSFGTPDRGDYAGRLHAVVSALLDP